MLSTDRKRIDYCPGDAARQALDAARLLRPNLRQQALIDYLIIAGLSALTHHPWAPPPLHGEDRDRWKLPPSLGR